jgi:glycosyltransferase involved in cell wall biosynthesis
MVTRPTALVDVLMPVKNGMPYIKEALQGILAQTLRDFRVIVLDHGSSDDTAAYVKALAAQDARIEYHLCAHIQGLSNLRNEGLGLCTAPFIAMHDADDVSYSERFERSVAAMQADPSIAVLGTCADIIDSQGQCTGGMDLPCDRQGLWPYFFFYNPIAQPTVMVSKHWLDKYGARYGDDFVKILPEAERIRVPHVAEDYFFFAQFALVAKVVNMPEHLMKYRWHPSNTTINNFLPMTEICIKIGRYLARCHALTDGAPVFDPGLFANHGHRLIRFLGHGPDFSAEFKTLRGSMAAKGAAFDGFEREMALRHMYAHRGALHMLWRLAWFALRHKPKREEYYPVLSYIFDGKKGLEPPATSDDGHTLFFRSKARKAGAAAS